MSKDLAGFAELSTPLVADACVRLGEPLRAAPAGVLPVADGQRIAGRALPVRHYGSVDVFLEAFAHAEPGDVLVIDNAGRRDEACIGDLAVLEAGAAGVAGIAVWGLHRDTPDLVRIGLPVFSYGRHAPGPVRLDPREPDALRSARFGEHEVTSDDVVFGDDDGCCSWRPTGPRPSWRPLCPSSAPNGSRPGASRRGDPARPDPLRRLPRGPGRGPSYTFRQHLRRIGGAIEE